MLSVAFQLAAQPWPAHGVAGNSRFQSQEPSVKKRIRVIQYGVGPIGAALLRLLREKKAIEVIGAIDSDPAKAGAIWERL